MSSFTTNLGNAGRANYLIADTQVRSPSFTQPEIVVGSASVSVTTATVAYVAGYSKYVFYYTMTDTSGVDQVFSVTSLPANFMDTNSATATAIGVASAAFTQAPIMSVAHQYVNNGTPTYNARPTTSTPATFSGTAYLKVIIQFTLD